MADEEVKTLLKEILAEIKATRNELKFGGIAEEGLPPSILGEAAIGSRVQTGIAKPEFGAVSMMWQQSKHLLYNKFPPEKFILPFSNSELDSVVAGAYDVVHLPGLEKPVVISLEENAVLKATEASFASLMRAMIKKYKEIIETSKEEDPELAKIQLELVNAFILENAAFDATFKISDFRISTEFLNSLIEVFSERAIIQIVAGLGRRIGKW